MKHFLLLLLFLTFVTASMPSAYAQSSSDIPRSLDDIQIYAYRSNPYFEGLARGILNERPAKFDFTRFRVEYSQTRQYDPMGTDTIERMLKFAYIMDTTKDAQSYEDALKGYQNIIMKHMAHLGVVMEALALSKTHQRYGDPELYKWLKHGLIRNLMISGDGYTLKGAYDVITMAEETVLFNYLGMRQVDTKQNVEYERFYNMHRTILLETGQEYTIFVETTRPMRFLTEVAKMQDGFQLDLGY